MTVQAHYGFQAEERALQQFIADIPTPEEYAAMIPADVAHALLAAVARPHAVLADPRDIALLRPWGLCDYSSDRIKGRMLSVLGMQVRRLLIRETVG